MKRVRYLGLGVAMALALLAFPAGASAAVGIEAREYPATLATEGVGSHDIFFTEYEVFNECTSYGETALLQSPSSSIAITPVWASCSHNPVNDNGCEFEFDFSSSTLDISPPGCGPMTTRIGSSCDVAIGAQTDLPVTWKNAGTGNEASVMLTLSAPLTITMEGGGGICGAKRTVPDGAFYEGTWEAQGFNSEMTKQIGLYAGNALFIAGKESGEESSQPRFEATFLPAEVTGEGVGDHVLATGANSYLDEGLECSNHTAGELTSASSSLSLDPLYDSCEAQGFEAEIAMNSCRYSVDVRNAGPPYVGGMEIACTKSEDAIKAKLFTSFGTCTMKIAPQGSLEGVSFTNFDDSGGRGIVADFEVKGIQSTIEGGFVRCGVKNGTIDKNGTYVGSIRLLAGA